MSYDDIVKTVQDGDWEKLPDGLLATLDLAAITLWRDLWMLGVSSGHKDPEAI